MAKTFTITLGGEALALRYKLEDREAVEALFPNSDGTPGNLLNLVRGHLERSGSIRVQIAILWGGLRHLGKQWTIELVAAAVQAHIEAGGLANDDLFGVAYKAILAHGALGRVIDVDAEEGKAQAPAA